MTSIQERATAFQRVLESDTIDLDHLSKLCLAGIPEIPKTSRPRCWRLLLGYEPPQMEQRARELRKQRRVYYSFVNDLLVDPFLDASKDTKLSGKSERKGRAGKKIAVTKRVETATDPLHDEYAEYYADNLTLEQIDKDVRRTLADIAFFQQAVPVSHQSPLSPHLRPRLSIDTMRPSIDIQLDRPLMSTLKEDSTADETQPEIMTRRTIFARLRHLNKDFGRSPRASMDAGKIMPNRSSLDGLENDLHWECIERILFLFAKLNPGLGYVQGMNELLAPLYFVLAQDEGDCKAHAEADTFYCFTALMTECRDLFERTHDHNTSDDAGRGMNAVLTRFMERLKQCDPELHEHLVEQSIEPTYYAFRWYCCMMAQEFDLPDVIRLWDSILADRCQRSSGASGFLTDFCCALLIDVRDQLFAGSFADNIKLLQKYPCEDIGPLLSLAIRLRDADFSSTASATTTVRRFIGDLRIPQFKFDSGIPKDVARDSSDQAKPGTSSNFPSMKSLSAMLSPSKQQNPTIVPVSDGSDRASAEFVRPQPVSLQSGERRLFHAPPPMSQSHETSSRLSFEFSRPKISVPSLRFSSAKKWFETVSEEAGSSSDPTGMSATMDSRFGIIKHKSANFFKKAGAFVSNGPVTYDDDELDNEQDGRVTLPSEVKGRRSRSSTLKR